MARRTPVLLLVTSALLVGCGGAEQAEPAQNDAVRLREQIEKQANQISSQAENGTAAIEQALENEGAIIFENRENLLNQAVANEAAPGANDPAEPRGQP